LDLAVSLLPGMDKEEIDLLFTAIKSPLQVANSPMDYYYYYYYYLNSKECGFTSATFTCYDNLKQYLSDCRIKKG